MVPPTAVEQRKQSGSPSTQNSRFQIVISLQLGVHTQSPSALAAPACRSDSGGLTALPQGYRLAGNAAQQDPISTTDRRDRNPCAVRPLPVRCRWRSIRADGTVNVPSDMLVLACTRVDELGKRTCRGITNLSWMSTTTTTSMNVH